MMPVIFLFRQDLRLSDQPALAAAAAGGRPVIPVFILDDHMPGDWRWGGASRWWLDKSLRALARDLAGLGSRLILRRGDSREILKALIAECGAEAVYLNRMAEPWGVALERDLAARPGLDVQMFNGNTLAAPGSITNKQGLPFKVFTPYWRTLRQELALSPIEPAPRHLPAPAEWPASERLSDWRLHPTAPDWSAGLAEAWTPGETGAQAQLQDFAPRAGTYGEGRDYPARASTSTLSPHLHWGECSPRQVWQQVAPDREAAEPFLRQLGWREFSQNLLANAPDMGEVPLNGKFAHFPWRPDEAAFTAWCRGMTGYPFVDAGMRQLWRTGWMHNRVRMVVASLLVKHLLIPWQLGERWFWDTLVDADMANNAAGWQWVAGCGADAAPYFRIFNPVAQGERFDAGADYIRRFVPELAKLDNKAIHAPWMCERGRLKEAGIILGQTYPEPIIDHATGRKRALAAFESIKDRAA